MVVRFGFVILFLRVSGTITLDLTCVASILFSVVLVEISLRTTGSQLLYGILRIGPV